MQMANFQQILLHKNFDLFFEILSLFNEKNQKVPKSAKRSALQKCLELFFESSNMVEKNYFFSQITKFIL